ncbi:MAG: PilW family protein [Zoogloeaceae bacterium]|jgi:hypothetical protein|nr:PilW family protein [Zoogloeaceae bacterium]
MRKIISGKKPVSPRANEGGTTIIEFLVASAIGLFVSSVVGYAYIANKESWNFNVQESRLQDRGRYITNLLNADLRLAGFRGCVRKNEILTIPPTGFAVTDLQDRLRDGVRAAESGEHTTALNVFAPVEGGNFRLAAALPQGSENPALAATPSSPAMITERHVDPSSNAVVNAVSFVLIDDCTNAAEFARATVDPGTGNITVHGATGVEHDHYTIVTWYNWGGANGENGIGYSFDPDARKLWRNGQLLADNVESFRVCLGIDSDGNNVVDRLDFGTSNFTQTLSVHIDLVLASSLPVLDQPGMASFNLCDSYRWTSAADRRLRRLSSTSVTLRNKLR